MSYKCFECGHLFDLGEERVWTEDYGETVSGCPICGGAYKEAEPCRHCGSKQLDVDLYSGLCIECIGEAMDKKNMTDYLEEKKLEADFYLEEFYKSSVNYASEELVALSRGGFLQRVALEQLQGGEEALACLRRFIADDNCGIYDFAEWLRRRTR